MADPLTEEPDDGSMIDEREPRSSRVLLAALVDDQRTVDPYNNFCKTIDAQYSAAGGNMGGAVWADNEYDLFWSSMEILKPAIYARPPVPVVTTRFKDRNRVATTAAELLERCLVSCFERGDMDQVMLGARDDLALTNRGVVRISYESDEKGGGQRICEEHVDRMDFLTNPARKWAEVSRVWFGAYMTKREMRKRFYKHSKNAYQGAHYDVQRDDRWNDAADDTHKAKVWECWHKADNKVYWVSEGCEVILDESEPFLKVDGFFPCPRPAYGTLRRRSLIPVPDFTRYESHLDQINRLTGRLYSLLDKVRLKGLIASGGDVGAAVEQLMASDNDASMLIPVPSAALIGSGGAAGLVAWIPLAEVAQAITGLIEARGQLIQDFYQLSGISDIMRGATDAQETLGAQQLKSQYGSIRVKDKIDELQRLARDAARISGEIIAEKFSQDTMLDMSQMEIPSKADVAKQVRELEAAAKKELEALAEKAEQAIAQAQSSGQPVDPQQVQQGEAEFEQAKQGIIAKYSQMLKEAGEQVVIEDVMKLLRDNKTRGFVIDIETDSTILVDEQAEKASRAEFLQAFAITSQAVQPLLAAGKAGAELAGGMLKFGIGPFRAGRELDGLIDAFVDEAPAAMAAQQGTGEADKALADANAKFAEAEVMKAQTGAAVAQANAQYKMQEMQLKSAEAQQKAQEQMQALQLKVAEAQEKARAAQTKAATDAEQMQAQINKLTAETAKILASIGLDERKQKLSEYTAETQAQQQQVELAMGAEAQATAAEQGERQAGLQERSQDFQERDTERKQSFAEQSSDRQMTLAERQAATEPKGA